MNFIVKKHILEKLEQASEKDEKLMSNSGLGEHYIRGKGIFRFRVVCEFVPEVNNSKDLLEFSKGHSNQSVLFNEKASSGDERK